MHVVSFDFGGTIDRDIPRFIKWAEAVHAGGGKVVMVTGVKWDGDKPALRESSPREAFVARLSFPMEIHYCSGDHDPDQSHGTKVELCQKLGVDIHVDNCLKIVQQMMKVGILGLHVLSI